MSTSSGKSVTIIITGASRGLGRSLAVAWSEHYRTTARNDDDDICFVLLARDPQGLRETQELLVKTNNHTVICCTIDLSQLDTLKNEFENILQQHVVHRFQCPHEESILIFVNNAGSLGPIGPASSLVSDATTLETLQAVVNFNVTSACWLSSRVAKLDAAISSTDNTSSSSPTRLIIVNISSLVAIQAFPSLSWYSAGKAARDLFHSALAQEQPQVQVLSYAPGPLERTEMTQALRDAPALDSSLRSSYEQTLVDPLDSAGKLVRLVETDAYRSGAHVDYYDDI